MAKVNLKINAQDNASPKLKGVTGSLIKATLAVDAIKFALTKLVQIGKQSIESFKQQEKVDAQLNAVLKSTQQAAGLTSDAVKDLADELANLTTYGDEVIQSGQNILLTFTKIGKDVFPQATETMLDMSAALGQDLKSSAIQLGKALNDPITGAAALRRVGVSLTEQQMEQIKVFQESGDTMAAQKLILNELAVEFGGSAKAIRNTFGGAMAAAKNATGDAQEAIGKIVSVIGIDFVNSMTDGAEAMNKFLSSAKTLGAIKGTFDLISEVGKDLGSSVFAELKTSVSEIMSSFDNLKGSSMDNINAFEILSGAINLLNIALNLSIKFIKINIVALLNWYNAIKETALIAVTFFQALADPSKWGDVKKQVNSAKDAFVNFGSNIKDGVTDLVTSAIDDFKNFPKEVEKDAKKYEDIWKKSNKEVQDSFDVTQKEIVSSLEDGGEKAKMTFLQSTKEMFSEWDKKWNEMGDQQKFEAVAAGVKKWGDLTVGVVQEVMSTIQMAFDSAGEERLAKIQESSENDLMAVDEKVQRELEALGLAEQTKAEILQSEIDTLRMSLKTTKSLEDQAEIQSQIKEKQDALARQKILDDAEKKKEAIRKKAAKKEYDEKKKQFEQNKALQIANIWINAASAVMGWLVAFAGMGIPGAVLFGVMTGMTLAMAGVQTGIVASQTFHGAEGGQVNVGTGSGDRAVTYMNKGEALLRSDDYNMLVDNIRSGGGSGGVYIENFYSSARNLDEMIEELTEISRREGAR